ncbi:MAG: hypothetical protein Q9220_005846 [cf. Caloplaca sp. 1 TL-2023]
MALSPSQLQYQQAHFYDDRSSEILGTIIAMGVLTTTALALRLACRTHLKVAIGWDDYAIMSAYILNVGNLIVVGLGIRVGSGRHLIAVGQRNVQKFLLLVYIFQIIYGFTMTIIKLSILLFYCRLFPRESVPRYWRAAVYIIAVLCILFWISGVTACIFQCTPVDYAWLRTGEGHCINTLLLFYITSTVTVVTDICILLLPLPIVWKLQMPKAKRYGVMAIFLLGSFVCIASIVRFFYLHEVVPEDATWTQVNPAIWSIVEPSMGIVSASLPIIGPIFRTRITSVRSTSWFSRSKVSGQGSSSYGSGSRSLGRPNAYDEVAKKPVVVATVYSRDTEESDEEMGMPLRDMPARK